MNFNTVAAAVLVVGISAMVISKVGDILVPEQYFTHKTDAAAGPAEGTGSGTKKPAGDPTVAVALAAADAARGEKQMQSKCKSCHTWNKGGKNSTGPNLWGVVGAKKGAHEGYSYSSAMKNIGGEWTYEKLYDFLKQPSSVVKGTKMAYRLRKYKQRADVIAFLRTLSDKPLPLPKVETAPAKKPDESAPEGKEGDKPAEKKDEDKKTDAGKKPDGVDKAAMEAKKKAEEAKKKAEEAAKKAAADAKKKAEEAAAKAKAEAEAKAKEAAMKAKEDARKAAEEAARKEKEKAEAAKKAAEEAAAKAKAEAEAKAKAAAMKAKEEAAKAAEKAKEAAKKAAEGAKPEGGEKKPEGRHADKKTE